MKTKYKSTVSQEISTWGKEYPGQYEKTGYEQNF